MKCLLVLLVVLIYFKSTMTSYCFWNSRCSYSHFSSRTPYNIIRGDIRDSVIHLKECDPVSIWGMYRHGKRQPGEKFSRNMKYALHVKKYIEASYAARNYSLCVQDIENLIQWENDSEIFGRDSEISKEGLKEMEDLAKRLTQAFPDLLGSLNEGSYLFRPVAKNWIEKSMRAFVKGFSNDKLTYEEPKTGFDEAAPYATCNFYQNKFRIKSYYITEALKYHNNSEFLAAKDRIQRRIGISNVLNDDNITALYDLCRYNTSGYDNKLSPWCALFTVEDLLVMEYEGDLRHYYRNGYGLPTAQAFGRIPLTDLLTNFKQAKEGNGKKIVAYVSHATMLDMVHTALGLFKDDEILTGEYRNPNRKWRTTFSSTFSANLVAVLNRCPRNKENEYNVIFYHNEEPLRSICEQGVCTWKEFEEMLTFPNTTLDFCDN